MSGMAVNVTTGMARVAYGGMAAGLEFLETLETEALKHTALGLAVVAEALLESLAKTTGYDVEVVRDKWLAELTDTANASP
jgi:hypothetical protein